MNVLWAPWRMLYINQSGSDEGCIFCTKPQRDPAQDAEQLILFRGTHCFVMMNLYPYNTGHLLVAPYAHLASLEALPDETAMELMRLTQRCERALGAALNPDGFNLGVNEGKVAGAGFPGHVHLHIVPRWNGDTNFMPVIGDVKVMPEFLQQTYAKIHAQLAPLPEPGPATPAGSNN
jgi:ATP adenylyltransferase